MQKNTKNLDYNPNFVEINDGSGKRYLPEGVVGDLAHDQRYLYDITSAIIIGVVPLSVMNKNIAPYNHSRWITVAS